MPYVDQLDPFEKFVVAVKHEDRRELPVLGLAVTEKVLDLLAMLIIDVFERGEVADHHLHLNDGLLDLTLEHLRRVEVTAALEQ